VKKLVVLLIIAGLMTAGKARANWLDDWYDNVMSSSSGPDYFEGQKRGYATFGSFSMRLPTRTDYLFSIEKPHLKVGCGGIDLFLGGFSFLNPDYLVEKIQRMIQAAPFIAFDIALNTLSPQLSETVKKAESIIDQLNQIQLSECGLYVPKAVVDVFKNPDSLFQTQAEKNAYKAADKGFSDLWKTFFDKYVHITDSGVDVEGVSKQEAVEGLPQYIKDWLASVNDTGGQGFVEYLINRGAVEQTVGEIFRAYIGDLYAVSSGSEQNMFNIEYRAPCREVNIKDALQKGELCRAPVGERTCICEESQKVFRNIEQAINEAYDRVRLHQSPSSSYEEIVKLSPVPVYLFVKYAVISGDRALLASLAPDVARGVIYAGLLDLSKKMEALVKVIDYMKSYDSGTGKAEGRELLVFIDKARDDFLKKLDSFEGSIRGLYLASLAEVSKSVEQALTYAKFMDIVERNLGTTLAGFNNAR